MTQGSTHNQPHGSHPGHPHAPPPMDLNVTWTVVVGFVGVILVFVFIVAIQILFQKAERAQYQQKVVNEIPVQLAQLRTQQLERIHTYRLVSEKDRRAAIPVELAMELVARDPAILAAIAPPAEQTQPAGASAPATAQSAHSSASGPAPQPPGGHSP